MSDLFKDVAAAGFFCFLTGFTGVLLFSIWTLVEQYGALETSALIMAIGLVVFFIAFIIETVVFSDE